MAMGGLLLTIVGIVGCGILVAAVVAVVWAISHDRRPPSR
jgi:hypothetical protein